MIASLLSIDRIAIKRLNLKDSYSIHKLIYSLFPGTKRDFLYYEQGGDYNFKNILVLSKTQPMLVPNISLESKIVPSSFLEHDCYAFQVLLNPVEQGVHERNKRPIRGDVALHDWFKKKEKEWGFVSNSDSFEIFNQGVKIIEKQNKIITLNKAEFRGLLDVEDRERFFKSFNNGIGRGKAFGFGLLQLKKVNKKSFKEY